MATTTKTKAAPKASGESFFKDVMALAAAAGWRRTGWGDISDATGVPLATLHATFNNKQAVLTAFVDHVDDKVLKGAAKTVAEDDSPRDRLFDVMMRRFDALDPYKDGIAAIAREMGGGGIGDAVCGAGRMLKSMAWMLEAAGISSAGFAGGFRVKGLAVVYASTFGTWLRDDSEDKAKTMAALDKNLARAERFASMGGRRDKSAETDDAEPGAAPQGA